MPKANDKIFEIEGQDKIRSDYLETIPYKGEMQYIRYKTEEFSALCPFSGLPDIARVVIEYIPDKFIPELKSMKYYLLSFRNVGIYQEDATNRIFTDLYDLLKPIYLKVETTYNTRGGIDSTCCIEKGERGKDG